MRTDERKLIELIELTELRLNENKKSIDLLNVRYMELIRDHRNFTKELKMHKTIYKGEKI